MRILAIDQGTTSTRAVVVEEDGARHLAAAIQHRQIYPRPGWVEHDAEELIANIRACIAAAGAEIAAVGLANQGESCLAWHRETGEALGPVIVWQDERTAHVTDRLRAEGGEALTFERAGLPLDPYFSASKLAWLLDYLDGARRLAAAGNLCLGTTDAFFRHRFTGRFETDVATASRTSLMNLETCAWDQDLCALFGVPLECLPVLTPTAGALGEVSGLPLTASIVDQQAALRGHGCAAPGEAKITFGTGAFVLAVAGPETPPAGCGALPTIAWQRAGDRPTYALDGGLHAAAAALNWARGLGLFSEFGEINAFDRPPAISRGVVFVPALAGLACPHWDRGAKGAWLGMGLDTDRRDLVQAVLEGVAFRTAEVLRAMESVCEIRAPVSIDGGMTANPWFCQFLADCIGRDVAVSVDPELTVMGTAALAAEGAGLPFAPVREARIIAPRPQPDAWVSAFTSAREHIQGYAAEAGG
ncbi:MAG: FGGY family carbohydrate kinase [Pseudomonadota bacterium]